MVQTIIVILIVATVLFFTVRRVVQTIRGKRSACNCGCDHCPATGKKECHCHDPH